MVKANILQDERLTLNTGEDVTTTRALGGEVQECGGDLLIISWYCRWGGSCVARWPGASPRGCWRVSRWPGGSPDLLLISWYCKCPGGWGGWRWVTSHNPRRLPRRFRGAHISQRTKSGDQVARSRRLSLGVQWDLVQAHSKEVFILDQGLIRDFM